MSAVPARGLRARWAAMALRERRLVVLAATVVGLVLLWTLLIEPAWQGRARLQAELPELRSQVAQIDALVAETRRLGNTGGAAMPLPAVREELERSLAAAGLRTQLAQTEVRGERIEMRFTEVLFPTWLAWLDSAQRSMRVRIVQASISREGASGAAGAAGSSSPPGVPIAPGITSAGPAAAAGAGAASGADRPGNGRVSATVIFELAAPKGAR